jgi:heptaprenyl diphosphate synthase
MKAFMIFYPKFLSIVGISIIGGVIHNLGQLLVAALIAKSWYIMLYLPILTVMGILAGILVGVTSSYLMHYINALSFIKNKLFITER